MNPEEIKNLLNSSEMVRIMQAEIGKDIAEMRSYISNELRTQTEKMYQLVNESNEKLSLKIDKVNDRVDKMIYALFGMIISMSLGFAGLIVTMYLKV